MTAETQRRTAEQITALTPLGRFGEPEEIAETVVWAVFGSGQAMRLAQLMRSMEDGRQSDHAELLCPRHR